jgi:hypothetical protein
VRRSTIAAALLTALTLGAVGPLATASAQPPGSDTSVVAQPPGDDPAACVEGTCTLRVTGPVRIPLDGRAGPTALTVSSIGPSAVAFRVHWPTGGEGHGEVGPSGTVRFGSGRGTLTVRVLELGPGAAVIELSTEPA